MFLVVKFIFGIVHHKLSLSENQFHNFHFPSLFLENLEGNGIPGETLFDDVFERKPVAEGLAVGFGDDIPGFESCLFSRRSREDASCLGAHHITRIDRESETLGDIARERDVFDPNKCPFDGTILGRRVDEMLNLSR